MPPYALRLSEGVPQKCKLALGSSPFPGAEHFQAPSIQLPLRGLRMFLTNGGGVPESFDPPSSLTLVSPDAVSPGRLVCASTLRNHKPGAQALHGQFSRGKVPKSCTTAWPKFHAVSKPLTRPTPCFLGRRSEPLFLGPRQWPFIDRRRLKHPSNPK